MPFLIFPTLINLLWHIICSFDLCILSGQEDKLLLTVVKTVLVDKVNRMAETRVMVLEIPLPFDQIMFQLH